MTSKTKKSPSLDLAHAAEAAASKTADASVETAVAQPAEGPDGDPAAPEQPAGTGAAVLFQAPETAKKAPARRTRKTKKSPSLDLAHAAEVAYTDAEAADAEAIEAEALADELEQRVLDGDETVTHDQIAEAKSRAGLLDLRREGRRRKAERSAHEARVAAVRELAADVAALSPTNPLRGGSSALQTAEAAVVAALTDLLSEIDAYGEKASEVVACAGRLGLGPRYADTFEGIDHRTSGGLMRGDSDSVRVSDNDGACLHSVGGHLDRDRAVRDVLTNVVRQLGVRARVLL